MQHIHTKYFFYLAINRKNTGKGNERDHKMIKSIRTNNQNKGKRQKQRALLPSLFPHKYISYNRE